MDKKFYDMVLSELKHECLQKGKAIDAVLYNLSSINNKAWREGNSAYLSKVQPISMCKSNKVCVKIHIK